MKTAILPLIIALAGSAAARPPKVIPMYGTTSEELSELRKDAGAVHHARSSSLESRGGGPRNECIPKYAGLFDWYTVHGAGFEYLGQHGERLEKELRGCTGLGDFAFARGTYGFEGRYTWEATFRLPLGQRRCAGHAVQTVGGQAGDCHL